MMRFRKSRNELTFVEAVVFGLATPVEALGIGVLPDVEADAGVRSGDWPD